jgi:hypothetical protein
MERYPTLPRTLPPPNQDAPLAKAAKDARDHARVVVADLQELLAIARRELETHEDTLVVLRRRCGDCGNCAACRAVSQ